MALTSTSANKRWQFLRSPRVAVVACSTALLMFIGAETVARVKLGLGDPPLYLTDPKIEYMNKPGHYHRFGHIVHVNQWSMRSPDFPEHKAAPRELRVLVIGDSVVNGGAKLDDGQVATTIFASLLAKESGRPTIVGNISAGSWGPPNQLAYLERFGTFDADAAIVVWSSHDAWDVPQFTPLGIELPTEKPLLASYEGVRRYAIPMLFPSPSQGDAHTQKELDDGLRAARDVLKLIQSKGIPVAVILHRTQEEMKGKDLEGDRLLLQVAQSQGVPVFQTESILGPAVKKGDSVFFDSIHPNANGNKLLAGLYLEVANQLLAPKAVDPAAAPATGGK